MSKNLSIEDTEHHYRAFSVFLSLLHNVPHDDFFQPSEHDCEHHRRGISNHAYSYQVGIVRGGMSVATVLCGALQFSKPTKHEPPEHDEHCL